jgi:hypothetical protein
MGTMVAYVEVSLSDRHQTSVIWLPSIGLVPSQPRQGKVPLPVLLLQVETPPHVANPKGGSSLTTDDCHYYQWYCCVLARNALSPVVRGADMSSIETIVAWLDAAIHQAENELESEHAYLEGLGRDVDVVPGQGLQMRRS